MTFRAGALTGAHFLITNALEVYAEGGEETLVVFLESARAARRAQEQYDAEMVSRAAPLGAGGVCDSF